MARGGDLHPAAQRGGLDPRHLWGLPPRAVAALTVPRAYTTGAKVAGRSSRPARRHTSQMRPEPILAGDDLYRSLLELSTEAIARFELLPPLPIRRSAPEQVEHILRHARIV